MAAESFGRVATGAPALKPLSFSVHEKVYDSLARRAAVLNVRPAEYARRLFQAAYAVRCAHEKGERHEDRELDGQVRLVFLMADCEGEFIAEALGLRDATVARILDGWRIVGGEIERPVMKIPAVTFGDALQRDPRSVDAYPPDVVKTIRQMWSQNYTAARIGKAVGKSRYAILRWAQMHRDVCPVRETASQWTDEQREQIHSLWAAGTSLAQIAKSIRRSVSAVSQYVVKNREFCPARCSSATNTSDSEQIKIRSKNAAYPPEMVETIRAMWAQGVPGKDIAAAIGKAEGALSMWMSKNRDVCPKRQR